MNFKTLGFIRYLMFEIVLKLLEILFSIRRHMKLKTTYYLLLGIFLLINSHTIANIDIAHKHYVSHLNMRYDEQSKIFQLSFSIFIDDLEMALKKQTGNKINLDEINETTEELVFEYINKQFSIKIDGEALKLKNIGYEIETDKVWVYIESVKTEIPESFEITNNILFELFSEQKNMVKIKVGENDYSALFTSKNPVEIIKLKVDE